MSGEELSAATGISLTQIYNIERGQTQPRRSTMVAISKALDVPVETLYSGQVAVTVESERVKTLESEVSYLREQLRFALSALASKFPRSLKARLASLSGVGQVTLAQ